VNKADTFIRVRGRMGHFRQLDDCSSATSTLRAGAATGRRPASAGGVPVCVARFSTFSGNDSARFAKERVAIV